MLHTQHAYTHALIMLYFILFIQRAEDAPMTENNKFSSSPRDAIGSNTVLNAFSEWDKTQTRLPNRDHTMLFTK